MTDDQRHQVEWVRLVIRAKGTSIVVREDVLDVLETKFPSWTDHQRLAVWIQAVRKEKSQ